MANVVVFSRMDEELKRALEIQAKRERRSLSNLLVGAAEFYLRQHGSVVAPDALAVAAVLAPAKPAPAPRGAAAVAPSAAAASTTRKPARKRPGPKAASSSE
jgi:hypothetical protein